MNIFSGNGEQEVEMALYTPLTYTRADDSEDPETEIKELDLVVCKDGKYLYTRPAYKSSYAKFRSILKIDSDVTICFFANCRDLLAEYADIFREGEEWEDIYPNLIDNHPDRLTNNAGYLPMWGQLETVTVADQKVNDLGTVTLLRSVAAAEVLFTLQNNEFVLKEGYVYYAADQGYIVPSGGNLVKENGELTGVLLPECPSAMQTGLRLEVKNLQKNSIQQSFYFYDNDVVSTGEIKRRQTRLVVGGYFNGETKMTYYPLDFKYEGSIVKPIRNQKYRIIVTAVNSEGWESPGEAAEAAAVNMDYDVIPWDEYTDDHIGIDGTDYLSLQKKTVELFREAGSAVQIYMHTTYESTKLNLDFVESYNGTVQREAGKIWNDRFEVEVVTDAQGEVSGLLFTALENYNPSDVLSNKQTLKLTAGRIRFDITITQLNYNSNDWNDGGDEERVLG